MRFKQLSFIAAVALATPCATHPAILQAPSRTAPINAFQSKYLDAYLTGATYPSDLGNGGGRTAQVLAQVGREDLVMGRPFSHGRRTCKPLQNGNAPVDPISFIAKRASSFRVTMVNEAHDMPQGRAFDTKIANALREESYRFYGAETFSYSIGSDGPTWPLLTDGFYAQEPIYGRLIRTLRSLGFRLFPYEANETPDLALSQDDQINRREETEAGNLAARVKAIPKDSKVIVHVGYGHLNKNDDPGSAVKMMAARFREDTGIDPLTVDQTMFWSPTDQYVVCDPVALHLGDPAQIVVGAARPSFSRSRPRWRLEAGDNFVELPEQLKRPDEVAIYEARYSSEPDNAVPVDRILVRPGESIPLLLPSGTYKISVWTKNNGWAESLPISVAH